MAADSAALPPPTTITSNWSKRYPNAGDLRLKKILPRQRSYASVRPFVRGPNTLRITATNSHMEAT